jgi:hypothetical protein
MHSDNKTLGNRIKELIKTWDIFGVSLNFRIEKDETYKTLTGSMVFLTYFILSFIFVSINFFDFINRKNFTITNYSKFQHPTPLINLANIKYSIGFRYTLNSSSAIDIFEKYLNMTIYYSKFSNETNIFYKDIKYNYCTKEDFPEISERYWVYNRMDQTMCPKLLKNETDFDLTGAFLDDPFYYLMISIDIKNEYVEQQDFIKELIINNPIYINLIVQDTKLDVDNFENLTSKYINYADSFLNYDSVIYAEVHFSKLITTSDSNYIFKKPFTKEEVIMKSYNRDAFRIDRASKSIEIIHKKNLANYFIISSPHEIYLERSYLKLPDFLAVMGGIISPVGFILSYVVAFGNQKAAIQKILNKNFKYKGNKQFKLDQSFILNSFVKKKDSNQNLGFISVHNISKSISKNENIYFNKRKISTNMRKIDNISFKIKEKPLTKSSCSNLGLNTNVNILKKNYYNKAIVVRKANLNFWSIYLSALPCLNSYYTKINNLLNRTEEQVEYFLDIFTYFKLIREFEEFKRIYMNEDERNLLDYIAIPNVYSSNFKSNIREIKNYKLKIQTSFNNLKNISLNENNSCCGKQISAKLLDRFSL